MKLMQATIGKFDGKTIGDYVIHYYIDVESLSLIIVYMMRIVCKLSILIVEKDIVY